jgi:uncharacterized membrane protein
VAPPGHQWWQPTVHQRLRNRRTAIVLVGLSSIVSLLVATYGLVNLTFEARALHAHHGWHQPFSADLDLLLFLVWFYSIALLLPASAIGASALLGHARTEKVRATAFVALMCVGVVGQIWGSQRAVSPPGILSSSWLHDGRSWFALMSLLAIVVFVGAARLLKPTRGSRHA